MKSRDIKFTKRRHSQYAIFSVFLGLLALLSEAGAVYISSIHNGEVTQRIGFVFLFSALFAFAGIIMGGWSLYGQRYFKAYGIVSVVVNLIVLVIFGIVVF